ncbi:MAG: NHLP family bacteriocin export ABC transporter peptidase/permease/ATPase subunit, partial [Chroococcidiopsidaceae cyanobacterium CP_BM_ER_R8_30]|nr:NHLP family bacteriocin export ABC transporter peptidase/permease/ATPase subunit [Chroococcidiopsidaceae cyanobacterium CP_BM_ER_R8_30]
PYIVFWNFNHFLVVEGFGKDRVFINDPAAGPRSVSLEEFDQSYTGIVMVLEPGPDFKTGGRKPSIVSALRSRLQGSIGAVLYAVLAGFLLVIPGLAVPVLTQVFVDNVLVQGQQDWLFPLLMGLLFIAVLQGLLTQMQLRHLRRLRFKLAAGMSSRFLWHLLRLPSSFYDQRFAGEISNRITLNDQVAEVLSGRLATTIIGAATVFLYALVMFVYDWQLTLIVVFFAVANVLTLHWVSRQRVDISMRFIQENLKASGVAIAALQSIETLKASALESDFFSRWSGYYAKSINAQQELGITNQTLSIMPSVLSSLTVALLLVTGGLKVINGSLSIGMLLAFLGLMQNFQRPINTLLDFGGNLQELEGGLNRLDDVLQNPVEGEKRAGGAGEAGGESQSKLTLYPSPFSHSARLRGYVELRNVTFGYNRVEAPLIENFCLSIKPGQRVALVGGSGSGKSTVAKLVTGLYEPWTGEILFDGQPRAEYDRSLLANSLAMVEQDILLFSGSVRENLALWDATLPDSSLVRACQDAAIHDVVQALPGGYDGHLMEGAANLSGGQRQRLEIARALVHNPAILVMDEATAALDAETEKIIDHNLRRRGCSCLIVAHRLSTIRDCDEIIVLERGQVVQRGTHQELQQVDGTYSQLISNEGA